MKILAIVIACTSTSIHSKHVTITHLKSKYILRALSISAVELPVCEFSLISVSNSILHCEDLSCYLTVSHVLHKSAKLGMTMLGLLHLLQYSTADAIFINHCTIPVNNVRSDIDLDTDLWPFYRTYLQPLRT